MKRLIRLMENRIARLAGLDPATRPTVIRAMLKPRAGEAVGYWLQLMMAAALATLGLALNSTAVVIGAMLIAPLMRPIVELAMGLATGSASLVFRAGQRTVASIIAVTAVAALISWLLPFHSITHELAARTVPSLLDLVVAAACALAGAYATLFSASEMASTAAGTSIGISLAPPLCTLGYALSIGEWQMARGAALLFTANVTGIVTVAGLVFVIVGFGQVDVRVEEQSLDHNFHGVASRLGRDWSQASKRLGVISRLVLPLLLLAAIFIPLRRAFAEMTRRTEIRQQIEQLLTTTKIRVAQSSIDLGVDGAVVRVVIVGDSRTAEELDAKLRAILAKLDEPEPRLSVWAVPDAKSLGALTARIDELPPVAPPTREPARDLAHHTPAEVAALVAHVWPAHGGALASAWLEPGPPLVVHVVHFGPQLGDAARDLLSRALAPDETIRVVDDALDRVDAEPADAVHWIALALRTAELSTRAAATVALCITVPAVPVVTHGHRPPPTEDPSIVVVRQIVEASLRPRPGVTIVEGQRWSLVPTADACAIGP